MKRKGISQREARRLRQRVRHLEAIEERRFAAWSSDWPGGVNFTTVHPDVTTVAMCRTVQLLGHAIVARLHSNGSLLLFAVKP